LRLPHQYTPLFIDNEHQIYTHNESTYFNPILLAQSTSPATTARNQIVHTVRSGETLGGIALRYRVKVSDLQYWNNLKNTTIRIGQRLVVYSAQAPAQQATTNTSASNATSSNTSANTSAIPAGSTKITHEVKSGETLGLISQKYRVTVANLQSWNNLRNTTIRAGQKLTVYTQNAPASTTTTPVANVNSAASATFQWYTVKSGDTLWNIARNHGVSLNDLLALNGLNTNSKIAVGNRLKIKAL